MSAETIVDWLETDVRPKVDRRIDDHLSECRYGDRLQYQLEQGGKRVRPGIVLAVGDLCGLDEERQVALAAGVELLHTFTLVHDDVMDEDCERRGSPTVWKKWDVPTAVNVGNLLCASAFTVLPRGVRGEAARCLVTTGIGNQTDMDHCSSDRMSEQEYLRMAEQISAPLLDFAAKAPAALTGADVSLEDMSDLGLAYTIQDTIMDFDPSKGKAQIGNDVRAGKQTIMVIHADDPRVYDVLEKPFEETTDEDVQFVYEIFRENGSIEYARKIADDYVSSTIQCIERLPQSEPKERLLGICALVQRRTQ